MLTFFEELQIHVEARRIRTAKEQGIRSYLTSSDSITHTHPLTVTEISELAMLALRIAQDRTFQHDYPIICIGRSPRWFAECFKILNRNSLAFNYSGKSYLRLLESDGSNLSSYLTSIPFDTDALREMRLYLTSSGIKIQSLLEQNEIYLMDYITGGGGILSFIYFLAHWQYDLDENKGIVSDPLLWLKKPECIRQVNKLIEKIKIINICATHFVDFQERREIQEQIEALNTQVKIRLRARNYIQKIAYNNDHTLGFELPVTHWSHAQDWNIYEQYPDRRALKTLEKFKGFLRNYQYLLTIEDPTFVNELVVTLNQKYENHSITELEWTKALTELISIAKTNHVEKISLEDYFKTHSLTIEEAITACISGSLNCTSSLNEPSYS